MQNIFIDVLPPWVETGLQPAFYDLESGTVLQQTARMWAKMRELGVAFNTFTENVTNEINQFEQDTNDEIERFEQATNDEIERFEGVVNDTVEEYIEKFNELHDYVQDYFDNLDVQEEINNKLDDMVEQGTLQEIIGSYLNATALWGFNSISELKASSNLIDGSFAKTSGYYAANDGGGAFYTITDDELTGNDGDVIALNNGLFAVMVTKDKSVNVKCFGAYGDDTHDDTNAINNAIAYAVSSGIKDIYLPAGTYKTTKPIYLFEYCKLHGENYTTSTIHKATNDKGDIAGFVYDAAIIMTDTTFDTSTALSNSKAFEETICDLTIRGCIESYVADKDTADRQYGIYSFTNIPKAHIHDIQIEYVDCGIDVKRCWTGYIKNIPMCRAFYVGVRISSESQGTVIEQINILNTSVHGLYIAGGTYGSIRSILVEYPNGGNAFYLDNWHGDLIGCGTELGTGANIAFRVINSKVSISGAYVDTTTFSAADNRVISVQGSDVKISDSAIGHYAGSTTYTGKFATIYNGTLDIDNSNKILCTFTDDITTSGGIAFVTYDVGRGTVSLPMPQRTISADYDYIDSAINPSVKHPRSDIYTDNITYPYKNTANGSNNYGMAYGKGDVGIIRNPLVSGHVGWFCNRDNKTDNPTSANTITTVNASSIVLSSLEMEDYANSGIRFFAHALIKGVTSGATAEISRVEPSVNTLVLTNISGTFEVGEKVQLQPMDFWRYADYLYIPFIHAGYSNERPTENLVIGQTFYDRSLNKPIWYKGSNVWVDATGATV